VFREFKYELPSTPVKRFVVTRDLVDQPMPALAKLLAEHAQEERVVLRQLVNDFAERFTKDHGIQIAFTPAAADRLVALASETGRPVRDLCTDRFRDYQFGLKLITQNTGQREFQLDLDAVESPDETLSKWVVASYRPAASQPA